MSRVDPAVAHIVNGYDDAVRSARTRVEMFIRSTWGGLEQIRDPEVDRFVKRVVPVVAGGQRNIASLTDAYLAALERNTLGTPARPLGIPAELVTTDAMRGVPAVQVYRRPAVTVYTALSKGVPFDQAMRSGLSRALEISSTDLQLARTHTMRYLGSKNDRIVGYRRVPGGGDVCELCLEASTQRYHVEDLMPIHGNCSCGVDPIFGTEDPGQVVDQDLLDSIHNNRAGIEDADTQFVVHEHGEIGPMLAVAGQTFTGPDDLDS